MTRKKYFFAYKCFKKEGISPKTVNCMRLFLTKADKNELQIHEYIIRDEIMRIERLKIYEFLALFLEIMAGIIAVLFSVSARNIVSFTEIVSVLIIVLVLLIGFIYAFNYELHKRMRYLNLFLEVLLNEKR